MKKLIILLICAFLLGCSHVIRQDIRDQVDRDLTPEMVFKDPDACKGKMVMLGGIIISSRNSNEGTYLEVLQQPLDRSERPEDTDMTLGRFIIFYGGYLDSAVYAPGRAVTVAGKVRGKTVRPLDTIEYTYPLIESVELHIVERGSRFPIGISIGVGATF